MLSVDTPDYAQRFDYQGRTIEVAFWQDLVTVDTKATVDAYTFALYVYRDPFYKQPLVLATNLRLEPQTAYLLYRDRWPVEQPPLATIATSSLHTTPASVSLNSAYSLAPS